VAPSLKFLTASLIFASVVLSPRITAISSPSAKSSARARASAIPPLGYS